MSGFGSNATPVDLANAAGDAALCGASADERSSRVDRSRPTKDGGYPLLYFGHLIRDLKLRLGLCVVGVGPFHALIGEHRAAAVGGGLAESGRRLCRRARLWTGLGRPNAVACGDCCRPRSGGTGGVLRGDHFRAAGLAPIGECLDRQMAGFDRGNTCPLRT